MRAYPYSPHLTLPERQMRCLISTTGIILMVLLVIYGPLILLGDGILVALRHDDDSQMNLAVAAFSKAAFWFRPGIAFAALYGALTIIYQAGWLFFAPRTCIELPAGPAWFQRGPSKQMGRIVGGVIIAATAFAILESTNIPMALKVGLLCCAIMLSLAVAVGVWFIPWRMDIPSSPEVATARSSQ